MDNFKCNYLEVLNSQKNMHQGSFEEKCVFRDLLDYFLVETFSIFLFVHEIAFLLILPNFKMKYLKSK